MVEHTGLGLEDHGTVKLNGAFRVRAWSPRESTGSRGATGWVNCFACIPARAGARTRFAQQDPHEGAEATTFPFPASLFGGARNARL